MSNYRDELVQVAAVAVAAIQCYDDGNTSEATSAALVMVEVMKERERQEEQWGVQAHSPERWLTILHEETGEVARAILEGQL